MTGTTFGTGVALVIVTVLRTFVDSAMLRVLFSIANATTSFDVLAISGDGDIEEKSGVETVTVTVLFVCIESTQFSLLILSASEILGTSVVATSGVKGSAYGICVETVTVTVLLPLADVALFVFCVTLTTGKVGVNAGADSGGLCSIDKDLIALVVESKEWIGVTCRNVTVALSLSTGRNGRLGVPQYASPAAGKLNGSRLAFLQECINLYARRIYPHQKGEKLHSLRYLCTGDNCYYRQQGSCKPHVAT